MSAPRRGKSDFDALPPAAGAQSVAPRRRGWQLPLRAVQLGCRAIVALTMSVSLVMLLVLWMLTRLLEVSPGAD